MKPFTPLALLLVFAAPAFAQQPRPSAPADTAVLPPQEIGTIQVGQTRPGILEPGDYTMGDGTWADVWYVELAAGQRVVIDVHSDRFDAYAQLLDPWGDRLADDDNAGPGNDSRITFTVRTAGRFQIVVNNYDEDRREGRYTVTVR